jgi:uncharacterized protein (DUF169 family)
VAEEMLDEMKEKVETIKETLDLELEPVAVNLFLEEDDVPDDYEKADEKLRHCEFVMKVARGEIDKVYATAAEQLCGGGAAAIGVASIPEPVKTGAFYHKQLGQHMTPSGSKGTVDLVPKAGDGEKVFEAVGYAAASDVVIPPDAVLIVCTPKQALHIVQAYLFPTGGRVEADFSGIQSLCGDAVGGLVKGKEINVTLGCNGSRTYAKVPDECVIVALKISGLCKVGCAITEIPIP